MVQLCFAVLKFVWGPWTEKKKVWFGWLDRIGTVWVWFGVIKSVWFGLTKFALVEFEVLNVCMKTMDTQKNKKTKEKKSHRVEHRVAAQLKIVKGIELWIRFHKMTTKLFPSHHFWVAVSLVIWEGDVEVRHGPEYGHQRLDSVAVDDWPVLLKVLAGEAALVYDLHLLDYRALPRLSSPCTQI